MSWLVSAANPKAQWIEREYAARGNVEASMAWRLSRQGRSPTKNRMCEQDMPSG